jgi:anti-anti-sigma factor
VNDTQSIDRASASPSERSVSVILDGGREQGYVAIVEVCGEHDIASADDIAQALQGLYGSVLVDLSQCQFIDSTVIGVLLESSRIRAREGQRLDLLVPTSNAPITRTLEVSGIRRLVSVYDSRP